MLSDMGCSTLSFDTPTLLDPITVKPEHDALAPLDFDDLLDIAHEFEFARTVIDIWSRDEEFSASPETGFDSMLAAIAPSSNEECLIRLPSAAESVAVQPLDIPRVDSRRPTSVCPAPHPNACQVQAEAAAPIALTLQGWSPPNGFEFLDLDASLLLPRPAKDVWNPPWPATLLTNSSMELLGESQSFATVSAIGDRRPKSAKKLLPVTTATEKTADDSGKKNVPNLIQSSMLEPLRGRSPERTARTTTTQAKSRSYIPSTPLTGTGNYARPPRGGIPPHIARSVTKVNILRIEKERKVMQDAFASTNTGSTKKPSVLRRTATTERETNKNVDGSSNGKFGENDEKERRAVKRARV